MTCKTVRETGITPPADESVLLKMSAAELQIMEASPLVDIQSHTYGLHGVNTSYSDVERISAMPLETETELAYKEIFAKDCALAEEVLAGVGVKNCFVLSYPNGKCHEWAEAVLRERNYRVSVTTDGTRVNRIFKGKPKTLFSLGRMNVNDDTTTERLLLYLEATDQ